MDKNSYEGCDVEGIERGNKEVIAQPTPTDENCRMIQTNPVGWLGQLPHNKKIQGIEVQEHRCQAIGSPRPI
ncbi:hypothetical protein TNCV_4869981 [Trichonephila clavipes]|nr:hypothetical protein TNCV_4869981 [Trichonephila clavipes]